MSALTKIFVVLLVVMSLMLSAAVVVFVNRTENFRTIAATAQQNQQLAEKRASVMVAEVAIANSDKRALATELTNQINTLRTQIADDEAAVTRLNAQIAEKDQAIAAPTTANGSATAALQVAQADIKARQDAYNTLFAEKNKIQEHNVEDGNKITELTSANEILKRQSMYVQEQISQLQQQNDQLSKILRTYNISPTGNTLPAGGAINTVPSVNINGIVRDFRNINGVPFATISLGSADAVTHGMQFKVIDPAQKKFLGYLTIDTVGVHEATGRLDGPGVDQVRANVSEVRTQL